ncbi:hypothetical protein NPJ88_000220 [Halomonas elongata]|uniref:hypothetical protein n=1 Tax=Halomonas elongata TaxID=2746 RepID=UPI00255AFB6C|nr:hypothetical protein [Halomonas elongata]MDL4860747.1 hypothetical protein [Halomonas elongata]
MAHSAPQISTKLRKHLPEGVLTDDIAYDDIICASSELTGHLQRLADNYNLSGQQLLAVIKVALEEVLPDERLYAAINSTAVETEGDRPDNGEQEYLSGGLANKS